MHYICTGGCNGVSDQKGVCQAPNCADYHENLKECDCEDGKHAKILKSQTEQDTN